MVEIEEGQTDRWMLFIEDDDERKEKESKRERGQHSELEGEIINRGGW